jgi:hypothetical protein
MSIDYPFAILHNFILLLSYHCNFWIYVGLSARFRRTLKDMLLGFRVKRTFERVMSMSRTDSFSSRPGYPLSTIKHRHMNGNGATSVVKYSTVDCDWKWWMEMKRHQWLTILTFIVTECDVILTRTSIWKKQHGIMSSVSTKYTYTLRILLLYTTSSYHEIRKSWMRCDIDKNINLKGTTWHFVISFN